MLTCPACGTPQIVVQRFCGHCGASLPLSAAATIPPPDLDDPTPVERPRLSSDHGRYLPGVVLAKRYRMVALLGRGGMGEVYRADDLTLGQPVALKFLPRDVEHDAERRDRFLSEVRMSLRVTHPNVCRVYDIAQAEGRHFLSMEYVDGEDLASLLRRIGRLPEDKAVEISRQLCAGLQAAHDEGVLHRDLKPANVLLDGRGRAKITDFGLAAATEGISGVEARAGTPQYMAPEQIAGHTLSKQTDIYALGLLLYELFTGKQAFESNTLEDLERRTHSTHATTALKLRRRFGPAALDAAAAEARELREWACDWIARWRDAPGDAYRSELRRLNRLLARATCYPELVVTTDGFQIAERCRIDSADA